jgi:hypothetical protein
MSVFALSEPNWVITILVGTLLGAVVAPLGPAALYPLRRIRRDVFVGTWNQYYWTWRDGRKQMWFGQVCVKRGILKPYSVTTVMSPPDGGDHNIEPSNRHAVLRHRGELRLEGGHVIIETRANTHNESVVSRFPQWIPSETNRIVGIWMSFDHSGTPTAGAILLSRSNLDEPEASALIGRYTTTSTGLLRVRDQSPRPSTG